MSKRTASNKPKSVRPTTRTPQPLSASRYAKLRADVQRLVHAANKAVDHQKVEAHWALGDRIVAERVQHKHGYHNSVLRDLASDLAFSVRNLQYTVRFRETYAKCPKHPLSWLHYRALLACADPKARAHYTQLAIDTPLNSRQLAQRISADKHGLDFSQHLPRPTVLEYVYGVRIDQIIDGDTFDLTIDLGYTTLRQERIRLAAIDCPELPTPEGRAARDFVYSRLMSAKTIAIHSERNRDLHGRFVAHLYYSPEAIRVSDCITQSTHLNAELLATGHAVRMA